MGLDPLEVPLSALPRRSGLVAAVVAALAGLIWSAPQAVAAPEIVLRESGQQAQVAALAEQVAERQQTLSALNKRADARDRALVGVRAVLQTYGYTGDPDLATLVLPLAAYDVSAGFGLTGPLWEAEHGGQDFGASSGDPLVAVAAGTVTEVADAGPYGLRTILTLEDGTEVWYCHQASVSVYTGDTVDMAEELGTVGSTGNSTGPHLHLEVRPAGGDPVDPMEWLRAAGLNP